MTSPENAPYFASNLLSRTLLNGEVRAVSVHMDTVWQTVLGQRTLPKPVQTLLGELCAASALLSATLKLNGSLVLQLQGGPQSPIALIVVECNADNQLRAAVKLRENATIEGDATLSQLLNMDGNGRFVVVLDPLDKLPGQQAYTSLVPILGKSVSDCLDYYMQHSEQLPTRILLSCDETRCAGLLVQRMPDIGGFTVKPPEDALIDEAGQDDTWSRVRHYVRTLKSAEQLATDAPTVLHKLFWDEAPTAPQNKPLSFFCACSRHKVSAMLKMLGEQEVESALNEQEKITILCEYCDQRYVFDAVDCASIFTDALPIHDKVQ